MNFGYARVSAKDQHLDTQLAQLQAAGIDRVFHEKISGATTQRLVLTELLATLRAGDMLTVARLNRLGRNSAHIMQLVAELYARQVRFVALDLGQGLRIKHLSLLFYPVRAHLIRKSDCYNWL